MNLINDTIKAVEFQPLLSAISTNCIIYNTIAYIGVLELFQISICLLSHCSLSLSRSTDRLSEVLKVGLRRINIRRLTTLRASLNMAVLIVRLLLDSDKLLIPL